MSSQLTPKDKSSANLRAAPARPAGRSSTSLPSVPPKKPSDESSGAFPAVRSSSMHDRPAVRKNYAGIPSGCGFPAVQPPPARPLASAATTSSRRKRTRRSPALIIVGITMLLCGAFLFITKITDVSGSAPAQRVVVADATHGAGNSPVAPEPSGSANSPQISAEALALAPAIARTTRPQEFVDTLELNGKKPEFKPVSSVSFQRGTLQLYVLLRARLDEETLRRWKQAGLLSDDVIPASFLLTVRIDSTEALSNLYDWHVEGVYEQGLAKH